MKALILATALISPVALAADLYDWQENSYKEITGGQTIQKGETIETYDWSTGQYEDIEVDSVKQRGGGVEVESYNWETGEYTTYELE